MIPAPDREQQVVKRAQFALTPMIDCVFLLLIFFMVGMKFREEDRQVQANLPLDGPESIEPDRLIGEIWIFIQADRAGGRVRPRLAVGQRRVRDWGGLDAALARLARSPGATADDVILAADDDALHDWVMRALDSARRHGFAKIRFKK